MPPIVSSSDRTAQLTCSSPSGTLPEPMRSWSGSSSDYPRTETVVSLFESIVNEHSEKISLIQGDIELTYKGLNARANRLAHRLRRAGVTLETMVPCCLP